MRGALIDVVVETVRLLTPRVREYRLRSRSPGGLPSYQPGAHVELHTSSDAHGPIVRHYSLIGGEGLTDDPPDIYRIAVQREDRQRGSAHIHDSFAPGSELKISRPMNNFLLDFRDRRSLLIAGGIGITPIYSMARSLVRRKRDFQMIYAGRLPGQLAYAQEIATLCGDKAVFHYSGDPPTDIFDFKDLLARQSDETHVYVCGPGGMIEAVHAAGEALGWAPDRIRSEHFGAGPSPHDRSFDVELKRSGRAVQVGRDISILDALTGAGVDLLSDCRRGECGLCAVPMADPGEGIDHRDRYFSHEEHQDNRSMCICVSRPRGDRLVLDI